MNNTHGQYRAINTNSGVKHILLSSSVFRYARPEAFSNKESHSEQIKAINKDPRKEVLGKLLDGLMDDYSGFSSVEDMLYSLELL